MSVIKTVAYERLIALKENIQLLDYDVEGLDMLDCLNDESRPFGHSLVLKCVVENNKVWESLKELLLLIKIFIRFYGKDYLLKRLCKQ